MNNRGRRAAPRALGAALALPLVLTTVAASAAPPNKTVAGAVGARFRLHATTDAFGFSYVAPRGQPIVDAAGTGAPDPADSIGSAATLSGPAFNRIGFGLGRLSLSDDGMQALHPAPGWAVGFGVLFADYRAVAGARVYMAFDSLDLGREEGEEQQPRTGLARGQFVPYVRWMGRRDHRVRPYFEFRAGLGGGAITQRRDGDRSALRTLYPTVGLEAGASIFVVDYFSVDVGAGADYFAPFGRGVAEQDGMRVRSDWLRSADVINAALTLGLSVWFA